MLSHKLGKKCYYSIRDMFSSHNLGTSPLRCAIQEDIIAPIVASSSDTVCMGLQNCLAVTHVQVEEKKHYTRTVSGALALAVALITHTPMLLL